MTIDLQKEIGNFTKLSIIGVGSEIRQDDAVGLHIAKKLQGMIKDPKVEVLIGGTTPENLSGALRKSKPSHVLIVDAASSGKPAGTLT